MTVELDLEDVDYSSYMHWALEKGLWNGREISWKEAPKYYSELEQAIQQLLLSQYQEGYEFKQMAAELARIGGNPEDRNLLEKDIQELKLLPNGAIVEVGFKKSMSKFWKKHKKEILIGAAVVAVVTVVVVVTVCTAGGGAAAAAAASAGGAAGSTKDKDEEGSSPKITKNTDEELAKSNEVVINNPSPVEMDSSNPAVIAWDEILKTLEIGEITPSEMGAHIVHGIIEQGNLIASDLSDVMEGVRQLTDQMFDLGNPEGFDLMGSPTQNREEIIKGVHEAIDRLFGTNQAICYEEKAEVIPELQMTEGILPLPGIGGGRGKINVKKLSNAGKVPDRAGYTKAGRGLMKHGYREGSAFPKPVGNPSQINTHGQQVLESIISHPERVVYERPHPDFGKVIDIVVPDKWGARFTVDGKMIGFLEP